MGNGVCGLVGGIAAQLLAEVRRLYASHAKIPDDLLSSLDFVFGAPLVAAMDIVDRRGVSLVTSPSGRTVYQVVGSSGSPYLTLPSTNYCTCPAYRFSVLSKEDHLMCKHMLATHLSERMDLIITVSVTDKQLADMLLQIDPDEEALQY